MRIDEGLRIDLEMIQRVLMDIASRACRPDTSARAQQYAAALLGSSGSRFGEERYDHSA